MRLLVLLILAGGISNQAEGKCVSSAQDADLTVMLSQAEASFADRDVDAFTRAMDDVSFLLPCLSEAIAPSTAFKLHRMRGVQFFVEEQSDRAAQAFAAARALRPNELLSEDLVPLGHTLHTIYNSLALSEAKYTSLSSPIEGYLLLDGLQTGRRPTDWATFLQVVGPSDVVQESAYLLPGDPLPKYDTKGDARPAIATKRPLRSKICLGGVVVSGLTTGVLYGLAGLSAASFQQEHADYSVIELDDHRDRTNTLVWASAGAGLATVGFGVGLVLTTGAK